MSESAGAVIFAPVPETASPDDPLEVKARALRALFRKHRPRTRTTGKGHFVTSQKDERRQTEIVAAEYERLFGEPSTNGALEHILASAWIEERELAGQHYDFLTQRWLNEDGSKPD